MSDTPTEQLREAARAVISAVEHPEPGKVAAAIFGLRAALESPEDGPCPWKPLPGDEDCGYCNKPVNKPNPECVGTYHPTPEQYAGGGD